MKTTPKITTKEVALIKKAQAGDILAFNKLFYRYKQFVDSILYSYLKDMDEAQDLTNIVFLKVYDKLSTFTDYSSFGGWLRVLTNRTAIDYLRELKPQKYVPQDLEDPSVQRIQEVDYGESSVDSISYNQILELFKQFPEDVRRVFELHYIDNLTVSEISDITKIPPGTVKSHLFRKRKLLKQKLKL